MYLNAHEHPWCCKKGIVEILLDGRPVEKCYAAHEEEGWVDVHQTDARGRLVVKDGDVVELRLQGRVEIRPIAMSRADFERLAGVREW